MFMSRNLGVVPMKTCAFVFLLFLDVSHRPCVGVRTYLTHDLIEHERQHFHDESPTGTSGIKRQAAFRQTSSTPVFKHVVYDFDKTIAAQDVQGLFRKALQKETHDKIISGMKPLVSEVRDWFVDRAEVKTAILKLWFGGKTRIQKLRAHFIKLKASGKVKLHIASFGFQEEMRVELGAVGLLTGDDGQPFFENIVGRDNAAAVTKRGLLYSKAQQILHPEGLSLPVDNTILVDDSTKNIKEATDARLDALFVQHKGGMNETDMQKIEQWVKTGQLT